MRDRLRAWYRQATRRVGYDGPVNDHFDGARFFNPPASPEAPVHSRRLSLRDLRCWLRTRAHHPWQRVADFTPPAPPPDHVTGLRITWINHASVLIQAAGINILTDPIFSERASPVSWAGPRRYHPPGVAFSDLPTIDAVLVSHAHYDHLDRATIERLANRFDPLFVAGLGLESWLVSAGARRATSADWWQTVTLPGGIDATLTPARHWSRRRVFDRNRSLWAGYWLATPAGGVYFAGDTGMGPHFAEIHAHLGTPRVALLPIGAYQPRWFMRAQHMNPTEAVEAHRILGARQSIGIHFATFKLSDEAQHAPAADLASARAVSGLTSADVFAPEFGVGYALE